MRTIRITLQYDGTAYRGWQRQLNDDTIQGRLEDCIAKITGHSANVTGAGRTDAGVHALGQVASFRTSSALPPSTLARAMNARLPDDIRITEAGEAGDDFHARHDARGKTYRYIICSGRVLSPFLHRYTWMVPCLLDAASMASAAEHLAGRHDFSSFRGTGCSSRNPVRTLSTLTVERTEGISFLGFRVDGDFYTVTAEADAFMRHMVRNIVGTLIEAGRGKITVQDVGGILDGRDRRLAGPTAPPQGLFLDRVHY
jgi:tRNA pseudouridine38-40 synthase